MSRWHSSVATQVKFAQKQAALQAKNAKPDRKVTDFVRRIRRVLDKKSREHGGTEGTYLRECFLNWDADCSGTIDAIEFRKAIRSLGLDISQADASYLVGYYGGVESAYTSVSQNEMTYDLLIEDVVNASTHFLQPQPAIPQSARPDGPFPPVLRRFIKPNRGRLDFQVNQISLINSRGVNLHPTELAQSEQELSEQIDSGEDYTEDKEGDVGMAVNLEIDMLARYVARLIQTSGEAP